MPFPLASLAICNAAHSNNPISSKMREIKIMAMKAKVAFQTILVTSITSLKSTTPNNKASKAPAHADQPIDKSLGCHIIKRSVSKKLRTAINRDDDKLIPPIIYIVFVYLLIAVIVDFDSAIGLIC